MGIERTGGTGSLLDDETTSGGLGLAVWGFTTVVAVILGFASWQYAPPRAARTQAAHAEAAPSSSDEITGSIAVGDHGSSTVLPTRVVGNGRVAPMILGPSESPVTARDIEQLRSDLKEVQRRIAQMGLSGDGVSRRLDRLEERLNTTAAAIPTGPAVHPAKQAETTPSPIMPVAAAETTAPEGDATTVAASEALRLPQPRPETDLPAVTGSVPPKAAATTKTDRQGAAPPPVATVAVKPVAAPSTPGTDAAPSAPPQGATVAAIDLGGYRSLASLKKSWSDMTERYAEFGTGKEALARLRETDNGMEARLVAGPYPSQADAAKACLRMRALGVPCAVTGYTGQPLAAIR